MTNARRKGKKNERDVANWFKKWTGWDFHSTPASGGLRWGKDQRITGDIVPPADYADIFPFSVETKIRQQKKTKKGLVRDQINLGDLILEWDDCYILDYWEQCLEDAERVEKEPIMLLRNNGMPRGLYYTFFDHYMGMRIGKKFGVQFMYISSSGLAITNNLELEEIDSETLFKFVNEIRKKK